MGPGADRRRPPALVVAYARPCPEPSVVVLSRGLARTVGRGAAMGEGVARCLVTLRVVAALALLLCLIAHGITIYKSKADTWFVKCGDCKNLAEEKRDKCDASLFSDEPDVEIENCGYSGSAIFRTWTR